MVNLEIPNDYTFSPSLATPHLTINHDVAVDLDSTGAFEGPEKLLEVWFSPSPDVLPPTVKPNGLKAVSPDNWVGMLDLVNCKILSVVRSDTVDAYLLSESSMFVFPHKIILKTCGTTTLLLGLQRMLRIAAAHAGFAFHNATSLDDVHAAATPYRVFYSRKNFLFPDRQQGPHRSWKQEVKYLDDMFEGGSAYMVGKMNGDHWYLYITPPNTGLTLPSSPGANGGIIGGNRTKIPTSGLSHTASMESTEVEVNDETLEILMTDLDPENAKQFYLSHATEVAIAKANLQNRTKASVRSRRLSDGSLSTSGADDIFDVDDIDFGSRGTLTPTTEHETDSGVETTEGHALGTVVSDSCGLSDVYPASQFPDGRIDAYMFAPCGFSANGVIPAPVARPKTGNDGHSQTTDDEQILADHYFTVHVTPEPSCSFASFETNIPGGQKGRQTADIVQHVVEIFKPGRFSVTLFEAKGRASGNKDQYFLADDGRSSAAIGNMNGKPRLEGIPGYRRIDRIEHNFDDYDLVFRFYEREGWTDNGKARVGEN